MMGPMRARFTLALIASAASACTVISGLDTDYQLGEVAAVPSGDGGDAADVRFDAAYPVDGAPPPDGACTGECAVQCGDKPCVSCKEILTALPDSLSGLYTIMGKGGPFPAYCDMAIDNGGWTLVARSAASGLGSGPDAGFGWEVIDGTPTDETKRYSLGVHRLAFVPTQMLFGSAATSGIAWGGNVYHVDLPTNFVASNRSSAVAITKTAVKGSCAAGGSMHSYAGYTSRTDVFFFRDNNSDSEIYGLKPNGWAAAVGTSCSYASQINGLPGMIFVR